MQESADIQKQIYKAAAREDMCKCLQAAEGSLQEYRDMGKKDISCAAKPVALGLL